MPFDPATAQPVQGFDLSTAQPLENAEQPELNLLQKSDVAFREDAPQFKTLGELRTFTQSLTADDPRRPKLQQQIDATQAQIEADRGIFGKTMAFLGELPGIKQFSESGEAVQQAIKKSEQAFGETAVGKATSEAAAGIVTGTADIADIFTIDQLNNIKSLVGKEPDIPTLRAVANVIAGADPDDPQDVHFMEEGLARDIVRRGSEVIPAAVTGGGLLRQGAKALPQTIGPGSAFQNIVRQMGSSTAGADVTMGALSGAGGEIGEEVGGELGGELGGEIGGEIGGETGALIGSILLPTAAVGGKASLTKIFQTWKSAKQALAVSLHQLSDDEASRLLAEAMVREGMGPEDVARELARLGDDALPADVGNSFARQLKAAANKIPQVEGRASQILNSRQAGSAGRISASVDDLIAGNVDDAITRMNVANGPEVQRLYGIARSKDTVLSPRLRGVLSADNSASRALKKANKVLADELAAGDNVIGLRASSPSISGEKSRLVDSVATKPGPTVSGSRLKVNVGSSAKSREITSTVQGIKKQTIGIDVLDATKQELDDQIGTALRQGKDNKVKRLIRLKNIIVDEADKAVPEYKQARDLFAGQKQLEKAADLGTQYFKLNSRGVRDLTQSMGVSEKRMFAMGAKQAIEDKILDTQTTADQVKRLFGKTGDISKLRSLFDSPAEFNQFSKTMEKEAKFALTRRSLQGGSTTAKQLEDISVLREASGDAQAVLTGNSFEKGRVLHKIIGKLTGSKSDEAFQKGLEKAGDILIESGIEPKRLENMLRRGSRIMIEKELKKALKLPANFKFVPPVVTVSTKEIFDDK